MDTNTANTFKNPAPDYTPNTHLLQMEAWGQLKSEYGWYDKTVSSDDASAMVLFRRLPLNLTLAYIPMGPVGNWLPDFLPELDALCRQEHAIALKVEPDLEDQPALAKTLEENGFLSSPQTVQPRHTLLIDLSGSEEEILARMHQKTRYNIRLASRKGVVAGLSQDLPMFTRMMRETGKRNEFGVHTPDYYRRAYELFHPTGHCELFAASYEDLPLAALMVFKTGKRAWYFYGASTNLHRNLMPTYLLQWEAIRWAKEQGCETYDLWGIPEADPETLEEQFNQRNDGLWGVYRFKRGFGGRFYRTIGAWDRPYHPAYKLYRLLMKVRKRA
ncbi:MAG: peptidoglycan bridge formation glycyltransferase FemA/FemB family protein [Anaerolineales bacterium]|nr:peptidoglycan bridge formation glycyltransferase FemA/FemB family protein [Anaerolineales bacterium]